MGDRIGLQGPSSPSEISWSLQLIFAEIHPSFEAAAGAKLDSPTASIPPKAMILLVGEYRQLYC